MTIAQALRAALTLGLDRLDAQLLLLHALGKPDTERAWLLAHDADPLELGMEAVFLALGERRATGEPLAYITGHKAFFGLELQVDRRVLVPRPDTETLVDWALLALRHSIGANVMDLGTGSGAIALALKVTRPDLRVSAIDASADALAVARANAQRLHLDIAFEQGSWLDDVTDQFHLIASNPPYVGAQDPHLAALTHEPLQALTAGSDGLTDLRRIIAQSVGRLHPGGWLLLEHGYDQAVAVRNLLHAAGFEAIESRRDLGGIERCSGGHTAAN